MDLSPNQMLRLAPNKVDYLIPGGEMINEFLGEGPGARVCSQKMCIRDRFQTRMTAMPSFLRLLFFHLLMWWI